MKIKNITSQKVFLGFLRPSGIYLLPGETLICDNSYYKDSSALLTSLEVTDFTDPLEGIFKVATEVPTGVLSDIATAYSVTNNVVSETYDCSLNHTLYLKIDDKYTIEVVLPAGILTATQIVDSINTTEKLITASTLDNAITLSTVSLGEDTVIEFLDHLGTAHVALGFITPVVVLGTGTAKTVSVKALNPAGVSVDGVSVDIDLSSTKVMGQWITDINECFKKTFKVVTPDSFSVVSKEDTSLETISASFVPNETYWLSKYPEDLILE
jgi:hypothetical protein